MKLLSTIISLLISVSCLAQFPFKGYVSNRSIPPIVTPGTGSFTFSLDTSSHVSVGVYRNDSFLVKTIVSDTIMAAGSHTMYWNGTDDYGTYITANDSLYKIKILSNNVRYVWQQTIGNTSDSMIGTKKHHGNFNMKDLVFVGAKGYYCTGYSEGTPSIAMFDTLYPQVRLDYTVVDGQTGGFRTDNNYVCTDGTYVYWGAFDSNSPNNSFVHATRVSNNTEVFFDSAVIYNVQYGNPCRFRESTRISPTKPTVPA